MKSCVPEVIVDVVLVEAVTVTTGGVMVEVVWTTLVVVTVLVTAARVV